MTSISAGSHATGIAVVVMSCGRLGVEVANRLQLCAGVRRVTLVTAPYVQRKRSFRAKLRLLLRKEGIPGLLRALLRRLPGGRAAPADEAPGPPLDPAVEHLEVPDFHDAAALAALRERRPDLGVVAGTYILREEVFDLPKQGAVNLHCGKVPEYRGSTPGFWELYNGETEVGITIHRVTADLDAGAVLAQELFPLDSAPSGDPLEYLSTFRHTVLERNGIRLVAETVAAVAEGRVREWRQDHARARAYRTPDYADIRELRRRVTHRRKGRGA